MLEKVAAQLPGQEASMFKTLLSQVVGLISKEEEDNQRPPMTPLRAPSSSSVAQRSLDAAFASAMGDMPAMPAALTSSQVEGRA
eukprot:3832060-Karenia_brevis.AAC.1